MSKPDRFQRTVLKVLRSLGKGKHGPWPEPMVKAFRAEHQAVRRKVQHLRNTSSRHTLGPDERVAYRMACDDLLDWLDARRRT